jgi:hypothetical protein
MEKVFKFLAAAAVLGAVGWFFSQLGGEPRFAKFQGTGGGRGGAVGVPGAPGLGLPGLGIQGAKSPKAQPSAEGLVAPTKGPIIGHPPLHTELAKGDPTKPDQAVYFVDKDLSRYASRSTVPFTRIHQILVEGGHGDVAKQVNEFKGLLKEMRRGEEPEVESLAAEQEAVVIEIGKVLTGPEVEELLEEVRSELDRLQEAEAEKQALLEEEAANAEQ